MPPAEMQALKIVGTGKAALQTVPLPKPRDTYVLVRVHSVALNPTDWKHIDFVATPGCTVGCDFAGVVESVGSQVTKDFKPGDRIVGMTHGANKTEPEDGAFAQYALVKGDIAIRVPEALTFAQAATLGIGVNTVGQSLYQSLKLPLPLGKSSADGSWLLVNGGSTATGTLAIQYAVQSGCRVLSINSPHNDELVLSLGAEKAFDYHDPECAAKIRAYTDNSLNKAFDCISEGKSGHLCGQALSSRGGGKINFLLHGIDAGRYDVQTQSTLAYSVTGEAYEIMGFHCPPNKEDFEFAKGFWDITERLLTEGKIKVHPTEVRDGGLDRILEGLDDLRKKRVSGKKLVYNIL